jgi:hypothetical protein
MLPEGTAARAVAFAKARRDDGGDRRMTRP